MAWETGTAAGHEDLYDKLMTFLSTNVDLVTDGQEWEILRNGAFPYSAAGVSRIAFSNTPSNSPLTAPDPWPIDIQLTQNVKIKLEGTLNITSSGVHTFSVLANDQCQVYIDDVLVFAVYTANLTNSFVTSGDVNLTAGPHTIEVRCIQKDGLGGIGLGWKTPGSGTFVVIPSSAYSGMSTSYGRADEINPSASDFEAQWATRECCLRGPGLAAAQEIYVNLRTLSSVQNDRFNWAIQYATGFDPTKVNSNQPGVPASSPHILLWDQSIKYWFIANGRRFIVIAKISTTYASLYGGFYLPYGLPSEIPYPIACGASCAINARWSDQTTDHSSFWSPAGVASATITSLLLRRTDGTVDALKNIFSGGSGGTGWTYPYRNNIAYRPSPDSSYALQPVVPYSSLGGGNVWGELDGVFAISGFNNSSENTQVIAGKTYLVVQSGFRTTAADYAAILLE